MTTKTVEKSKATPASMWRKTEPEAVKLPSGNTAMLERPNMYVRIKTGSVPKVMMRMLEGDETLSFEEKQEAIEWQCSIAFAEPKVVVGEPGEGELSIDEIEDRDKSFVLEWVGTAT
jgi:hypothetical protein